MENSKIEVLKEWGLIKNQKQLLLYREIEPLLMFDKIQQYGLRFREDFLNIILLGEESKIVRYIKRARSKRNQLLIADTFLSIRDGFQKLFGEKCRHHLIKQCTLKNCECNVFICPEIKNKF